MARGDLELKTDRGLIPATREALLDALAHAQAKGDGFLVLSRPDGTFLQYDGRILEYRYGPGIERLDLSGIARHAFELFLAGNDPRSGQAWRDVTDEIERQHRASRSSRRLALLALLVGAVVMGLAWWYVLRG